MTSDSSPPASPQTPNANLRRWCVYALYGLAAFWGVVQVVLPTSGSVNALSAIAFAAVATTWAIYDFRVIERRVPSIIWLIYFFTWPLASLLHLIWTRGIPGVGYWVVNAVGMLVVMMLLFYPTFYLLYSLDLIDLSNFQLIE